MYRGTETSLSDFSGGMVTNNPSTELNLNQASTVDNIILSVSGKGFRSRLGDVKFNATPMVGATTPIQGLGYFKAINQTDYLLAVAGTKLFESTNLNGTMNDITGALTITSGQDDLWSFATLNNKVVGFGGLNTAPDAPFVYTGAGNATALGGTPPSAYGCFQANNRIFAYRTSAAPSTIYWSILGNEADWTGVGSGNQDIWTSDNDRLNAHAIINTSTVLLFKDNSIHQLQIGALISGAFPAYPLFVGTGCAGKGAVVVADGMVYFINSRGKMCVTDGSTLYTNKEIPALSGIDDQWAQVNPARYKFIQGIRHIGADFDHIKWYVSFGASQTTNNRCFIWDRLNNCWLQNTTASKANAVVNTAAWQFYSGEYDGTIYTKEVAATYADASNSAAVIDANWTSGDVNYSKMEVIKQARKLNIVFLNQAGGQIRFDYGFDLAPLNSHALISQGFSGGIWDTSLWDAAMWASISYTGRSVRLVGRGNFFKYRLRSPELAYPIIISSVSISGKMYGQNDFSAR